MRTSRFGDLRRGSKLTLAVAGASVALVVTGVPAQAAPGQAAPAPVGATSAGSTVRAAVAPRPGDYLARVVRTGTAGLAVRAKATTASAFVRRLPNGAMVRISCQAAGQVVTGAGRKSNVWNQLSGPVSGWVSDIYTLTPAVSGFSPQIRRCPRPTPTPKPTPTPTPATTVVVLPAWGTSLAVRTEPTTKASATSQLANGSRVTISCQATGERVATTGASSAVWNKISAPTAGWISNLYTSAANKDAFTAGIPRCQTTLG